MSAVNFVVSDRWIFSRSLAVVTVATLTAQPASAEGLELRPETVAAWDQHVAATEARVSGPRKPVRTSSSPTVKPSALAVERFTTGMDRRGFVEPRSDASFSR